MRVTFSHSRRPRARRRWRWRWLACERQRRSEWFCYIPETGGILSPKVEVFRKGSAEGDGRLRDGRDSPVTRVTPWCLKSDVLRG